MENIEIKFKTNINCGGCISKVKPILDSTEGIIEWNVDTTVKDKVLTVKASGITDSQLIDTINRAGYRAELIV